jgi:hypothetical protein
MIKIILLTRIVIFCMLCNASQAGQRLDEQDVLAARYFVGLSYDTTNFQSNPSYNGQQWKAYPFRQHDPVGAHVGAAYQREQKIIIAFRGISKAIDWVKIFKLSLKPATPIGLPGKVHTGFSEILESTIDEDNKNNLQNAISRAYQQGHQQSYEYIFTGHSFGGALSIISAGNLLQNMRFPEKVNANQIKIVNFAPLNVGNQILVNSIEQNIGRGNILCFANTYDVVPLLSYFTDYRNFDTDIEIELGERLWEKLNNYIANFDPRILEETEIDNFLLGFIIAENVWTLIKTNPHVVPIMRMMYSSPLVQTVAALYVSKIIINMIHSMPSETIVREKYRHYVAHR